MRLQNTKLQNTYFILRHGRTIYQTKKKNYIYPLPDNFTVSLTKGGKEEIKKSVQKLKKERIDFIYSSDFFRTRQTARIAAKELGIKKIIFDKRLRDVNLGIWHGRLKNEFYLNFPRNSINRFYKRPKSGESWFDVQKRMLKFLKETDKKHKEKNILIVSHGDPLWLLEGTIKNWSPRKFIKTSKPNFIKPGELRKLN